MRLKLISHSLVLLLGAIAVTVASHADAQPLTGVAKIEVSSTTVKSGAVVLYIVTLTNTSKQALCVPESNLPVSAAYRGQGLTIRGPGVESVDTNGDPTESELERLNNTVQVILPGKAITGVYSLSDYLVFDKPSNYRMTYRIAYATCGKLSGFKSLSATSSDWRTAGGAINLETAFSIP